ncbi:MAG TPA: M57 family metalloprotease [Kofleriaceae bacterium]|jgi:hypothetical protein|nr:M57 family metalloprotease [Kofleriaceae bacterium]
MFAKAIALVATCGAFSLGCGAEPQRGGPEETQEIIENLVQAGFPSNDIMVVDGIVYVGRDAEVSLEASREMLVVDGSRGGKEQYRTTNLVSLNVRTICVDGSKYTGIFSTALDLALENYTQLALNFDMVRTSGGTAGCDAVITAKISGPTGGSSGFPSGGLPFNTFQIGKSLSSFDVNTIEHVITHELGHCVGFRHSDFFDRSISCGGSPTNEGDGGVGAILIQGTPSGATVGGSIMNSCFRTLETGEFTNSDVTALNALY